MIRLNAVTRLEFMQRFKHLMSEQVVIKAIEIVEEVLLIHLNIGRLSRCRLSVN
jgi:hypothetical protein